MRVRYNIKTELTLALMPTLTIIMVLLFIEAFTNNRLLFSSLASSAFLIYLDPKHQTNTIRTLTIAQTSASLIGFGVFLLVGSGYTSAAISMIIAIAAMIVMKAMHPPAVSTALIFAFREGKDPDNLVMFFFAVGLLLMLIIIQRTSLWLIKRLGATPEGRL